MTGRAAGGRTPGTARRSGRGYSPGNGPENSRKSGPGQRPRERPGTTAARAARGTAEVIGLGSSGVKAGRRTVCVDWNGVLDTYAGFRGEEHFDPPRPGADQFLARLKAMGYRVVVLSTRSPAQVWDWLRRHGLDVHVDDVTDRKVPAVAYIDDR